MYEDYVDECTYAYADLMETMAMVDGEVVTEAVGGIIAFITANLGKIIAFIVAVVAAIIAIITVMKNDGGSSGSSGKSGGSGKSDTDKMIDEFNKKEEDRKKRLEEEAARKKKEREEKMAKKDREDSEKNKAALNKLEQDLNAYLTEYKAKCDNAINKVANNNKNVMNKIYNASVPITYIEQSLLGQSRVVNTIIDRIVSCLELCVNFGKELPTASDTLLVLAEGVCKMDPWKRNIDDILGTPESAVVDELTELGSELKLNYIEYSEKFDELIENINEHVKAEPKQQQVLVLYKDLCSVKYSGRPDLISSMEQTVKSFNKLKDILEKEQKHYARVIDNLMPKLESLDMILHSDDKVKYKGGMGRYDDEAEHTMAGKGSRIVHTMVDVIGYYNKNIINGLISKIANLANSAHSYLNKIKASDTNMKNAKDVATSRLKTRIGKVFTERDAFGVLNIVPIERDISFSSAKIDCELIYNELEPSGSKEFDETVAKAKKILDSTISKLSVEHDRAASEINKYITDLGQYGFYTDVKLEK